MEAHGGGGSLPLLTIMLLFPVFALESKINIKVSLTMGYLLGFLEGAVSDFATTIYSTMPYHYAGGFAFLDGDFLFPLVNVILIYLVYLYLKHHQ